MMRPRPPSFARIYSDLILPRCNVGAQTSRKVATRSSVSVGVVAHASDNLRANSLASASNDFALPRDAYVLRDPYILAAYCSYPAPTVLLAVRHSSNATNLNNNGNGNNDNEININRKGEERYKLAMEALNKAASAKQMHEDKLLQEQFDAMEKQKKKTQQREQQRQSKTKRDPRLDKLNAKMDDRKDVKDRAAGVAVVRTIVKQSNSVLVDRWDNSNAASASNKAGNSKAKKLSDEERWQQIAKTHMEEAAFCYGHPLALARLGNEALERAKADSDSKSIDSLIDREKCEEWVNESPIDLAAVIELCNTFEGNNEDLSFPYRQLALHLYEEAGKQGSAEGWYNLGHMLWDVADTQQNNDNTAKEKAMNAFHRSIELGDSDAMYFVAAQYLSHEEGEEGGISSLLSQAYNQYGSTFITTLQSNASIPLPTLDESELSSLSNELQQHGYKLLHLAAHGHNHGPALHHLALLHNQHDNTEEFCRLLAKAADTQNPDSLFLQGHSYYFGTDGYDQSYSAALQNFLAAAENEHVDAMVSAGAMLHQGVMSPDGRRVFVQRDQQKAFDLYQQAGELGSVEGWRNVVSCYATGEGVPKCLDTAKYIANTMLKEDGSST